MKLTHWKPKTPSCVALKEANERLEQAADDIQMAKIAAGFCEDAVALEMMEEPETVDEP